MSHESIHCGLAEHTCPDVNVVDLPVSWLSSSSCGGCRGCWWQLGSCGNAAASAAGEDPSWQQEFCCPFGHCWGIPPPLNCCPATAWNLVKMLNENCSQWNNDFKWENHFLISEILKIWPNLSVAPKTHPMSFTSLKNDFFWYFLTLFGWISTLVTDWVLRSAVSLSLRFLIVLPRMKQCTWRQQQNLLWLHYPRKIGVTLDDQLPDCCQHRCDNPFLQINSQQHQDMFVPHPDGASGSGPGSCNLMLRLLQPAPGWCVRPILHPSHGQTIHPSPSTTLCYCQSACYSPTMRRAQLPLSKLIFHHRLKTHLFRLHLGP